MYTKHLNETFFKRLNIPIQIIELKIKINE